MQKCLEQDCSDKIEFNLRLGPQTTYSGVPAPASSTKSSSSWPWSSRTSPPTSWTDCATGRRCRDSSWDFADSSTTSSSLRTEETPPKRMLSWVRLSWPGLTPESSRASKIADWKCKKRKDDPKVSSLMRFHENHDTRKHICIFSIHTTNFKTRKIETSN